MDKKFTNFFMKKHGWIRIAEAFFSIVMIAGVLVVVINKGYIGGEDVSSKVYNAEITVLREIQLNDELRKQIVDLELEESISWDSASFPEDVKNIILGRIPSYLTCEAKICRMDEVCVLVKYIDENVYSKSVAITATNERYDPKQLKLFCWID
jgi:hypothetical protein